MPESQNSALNAEKVVARILNSASANVFSTPTATMLSACGIISVRPLFVTTRAISLSMICDETLSSVAALGIA